MSQDLINTENNSDDMTIEFKSSFKLGVNEDTNDVIIAFFVGDEELFNCQLENNPDWKNRSEHYEHIVDFLQLASNFIVQEVVETLQALANKDKSDANDIPNASDPNSVPW